VISVDWVSFKTGYSGPPILQRITSFDTSTGELKTLAPRGVIGTPSHSSSFRAFASGSELHLSGNPVKILTGQNVYGTDDLIALCKAFYRLFITTLGAPRCPMTEANLNAGSVTLTRVDLCAGIQMASRVEAQSLIHALAKSGNVPFRGRGILEGRTTVSFGRGSQLGMFKCYLKGPELEAHPPQVQPAELERLKAVTDAMVRFEATYRLKALNPLGLAMPKNWTPDTPGELLETWMSRLELPENQTFQTFDASKLARHHLATYELWRTGGDMRALLSRASFFRHRKVFLEAYGIDIGVQQEREPGPDLSNVVPLVRVLREPTWWRPDPGIFWKMVEDREKARARPKV
jgi:II/X family phage/plasmid replication protein